MTENENNIANGTEESVSPTVTEEIAAVSETAATVSDGTSPSGESSPESPLKKKIQLYFCLFNLIFSLQIENFDFEYIKNFYEFLFKKNYHPNYIIL